MTNDVLKKLLSPMTVAEAPSTLLIGEPLSDEVWTKEPEDGQLAVDVYRDENHIVIEAPIAGVNPNDLDISIQHDMVTIRGIRLHTERPHADAYFSRECYWGAFSRSIILPTDVRADEAVATMDQGILCIRLPEATTSRLLKVTTQ